MEVEFKLIQMDILAKQFLANEDMNLVPDSENRSWKYKYTFDFGFLQPEVEMICLNMAVRMIRNAEPDAEPMVYLKVENTYSLTAGLEDADKYKMLEACLQIIISNIQGIVATRFPGFLQPEFLPPPIHPDDYREYLLKNIF